MVPNSIPLLAAAFLLILPSPLLATDDGYRVGDRDRCNRTVDIYQAVSSPPVTEKNKGRPLHCSYRIRVRPARDDWVVFVRFTRMRVGEPSGDRHQCSGGYLQIVDGYRDNNQSNRDNPGFYCGEIDSPKTFISETPFVKIVFHVDSYGHDSYLQFDANVEQQQEVHARYGQYPQLYPHRRGLLAPGSYCERAFHDCAPGRCFVQSPGFPGIYPRNLHCRYRITVPQGLAGLDLITFDVDGLRCDNLLLCFYRSISHKPSECPFDYVRVYDGLTEDSPLIVTLCGRGRLKSNVIASGPQMLVEFVSSPAGPLLNTGFHFKADNMLDATESEPLQFRPTGCTIERHLRASGPSTFSNLRSWYPANTTCTYRFFAADDELIKLEFLWFRIERVTLCEESLKLYDSYDPDPARILTKLCDMSRPRTEQPRSHFESTGPVLLVEFISTTGALDGSSLSYGFEVKSVGLASPLTSAAEQLCSRIHTASDSLSGPFAFPVHGLNNTVTSGLSLVCNLSFDATGVNHGRVALTLRSPFTKMTDNCDECKNTGSIYLKVTSEKIKCLCQMGDSQTHQLVSVGPNLHLSLYIPSPADLPKQNAGGKSLVVGTYNFFSESRCGPERFELGLQGVFSFPFYELCEEPPCHKSGPLSCRWIVPVYQGMDVAFRLEDFPVGSNCSQDVLRVQGQPFCPLDGSTLLIHHDDLEDYDITIELQLSGTSNVSFVLWWTLVSILPTPSGADVLLSLGKECEYLCASSMVCLKKELVCNGVPNCPVIFGGYGPRSGAADEDANLCASKQDSFRLYWWIMGFGIGLCACVVLCIAFSVCRRYQAGRRRFK